MAISANAIWEVNLGGNDNNGGGYVSGGTDYSLATTPQATLSAASVVNATTTKIDVSAGDYTCGAGDVGNILQITGGTATVGWYQITARSAQQWTLDRAVGTVGQTVVGRMGGALASPGKAAAAAQLAGQTVFIKYNASPYVATSATTNIAAGCCSPLAGTLWIGYDTTRSIAVLGQNRPTFQIGAGVSGAALFLNLNAVYYVQSMILDGNSQTTSRCYNSSGLVVEVKAMNGVTCGFLQSAFTGSAYFCEATGCTAAPFTMATVAYCVAHDNTTMGATLGAFHACATALECIAYGNNRSGFLACNQAINCISYGNSEYGFTSQNNQGDLFVNCIAENNTLQGWRNSVGSMGLVSCADYNNSARSTVGSGKIWFDLNPITGSSSFFVNAAGGNFALSAAGLALCKAMGAPSAFPVPVNATLNYRDVGAAQHQDTGGGGGAGGVSRGRALTGM